MVAVVPCFVYGLEYTKVLVIVLVHDAVKTALAILAVLVPTVFVIILIALALI